MFPILIFERLSHGELSKFQGHSGYIEQDVVLNSKNKQTTTTWALILDKEMWQLGNAEREK